MVNNTINVSAYQGQPPAATGNVRNYIKGPLYPVEEVLKILDAGDKKTHLWTRKCIRDVENMALDIENVRNLVRQAITQGKYDNSEWCVQRPTGPWAACDGYSLVKEEWVDNAHRMMRFEYYVKFAIGKAGNILLLVSCHISQ